ncbi:MAG: response regulator [Sphaerochaetaceae bacterium]|nr:response regulator [Deltaproteobacteria bacterium]MBN2860510.1 response regulator [Sphaerochaetaceae bacterium]
MAFNILIVDDSRSMRSVIKKVISMSGFKVDQCLEAENGREALDLLALHWVDIILSDINMPVMSGFEMLEVLGKDSLLGSIPVVVISTEGREERMRNAFELGAKGFIKKPFLPEDIKRVLYEVIGVDDGEYGDNEGDDGDLDF